MGLSWTPAGLLWAHKPIHSPRLYFQQLTHNTQPFFLKIKEKNGRKAPGCHVVCQKKEAEKMGNMHIS